MLYPPELQIRLADYPNHANDEDWVCALERDCRAFLREEIRVHGALRPDAYPNVAAVDARMKPVGAPCAKREIGRQSVPSRFRRLLSSMIERWSV